MLPHVVRFNAREGARGYADLLAAAGRERGAEPGAEPAERLAERLEILAAKAGLPRGLRTAGVAERDFGALADHAAQQWTGRFNPRRFDREGALQLYREAF
jgi:alcohol dehydrogenase class IV